MHVLQWVNARIITETKRVMIIKPILPCHRQQLLMNELIDKDRNDDDDDDVYIITRFAY